MIKLHTIGSLELVLISYKHVNVEKKQNNIHHVSVFRAARYVSNHNICHIRCAYIIPDLKYLREKLV